jgi:hypothetical protein
MKFNWFTIAGRAKINCRTEWEATSPITIDVALDSLDADCPKGASPVGCAT